MPLYRTTFIFSGVQQAGRGSDAAVGWTETWYRNNPGSLDAMLLHANTNRYIDLRRRFMPSLYRVAWIRVSDVGNPRASKIAAVSFAVGSGQAGLQAHLGAASEATPAQVTCALLVDFTRLPTAAAPLVENAHHRRFLIRGLPTGLIDGNLYNQGSPFAVPLRSFLDFLGGHETGSGNVGDGQFWELAFNNPSQPSVPITALAPAANPNHVTITALGLPVLTRGTRVTITRVTFPRGVNRVWTVTDVVDSAAGIYTLGTSRFDISGAYRPGGIARPKLLTSGVPNQYLIIGLRLKKTGGPFGRLRGRARAR